MPDRALPNFSATGRIPFASSSPAGAGAAQGVGGGEGRFGGEMDVDGGEGWEVPETPEQ